MNIEIVDIGRNEQSCEMLARYWQYQERRRDLLIRRLIPWDTRKNHREIAILLERRLQEDCKKMAENYLRSTVL